MPDDTYLSKDSQHTKQASAASAMAQQKDLIDLLGSEEDKLVTSTQKAPDDQPPEPPPTKKQRTSLSQQLAKVIGLSSSPRGNRRQHGKMDVDVLKSSFQIAQSRISTFQKTIETLQNEIGLLRDTNGKLHRRGLSFDNAYRDLRNENNDLKQELEREKDDHRKAITKLEARVNDLTRTNDRLRQMIVPASEKQVLDSDVVSRFTNLRMSILALVRQTWTTALKADVDFSKLSEDQIKLFGSISYERLRHLVFLAIHRYILGPQCYFLGDGFEQLERRIQNLEQELSDNPSGEDRRRVMEWRISTFKATERFRDNDHRLSVSTRNKIWDFLGPVQTKDAAAEKKGKKKLKVICENAVELGLMIRQLKDEFKVDFLEDSVNQHISQWEDCAEEVASVPASAGNEPGTIAYVIAGALFKSPKENLERFLMLEKAEVAVYE